LAQISGGEGYPKGRPGSIGSEETRLAAAGSDLQFDLLATTGATPLIRRASPIYIDSGVNVAAGKPNPYKAAILRAGRRRAGVRGLTRQIEVLTGHGLPPPGNLGQFRAAATLRNPMIHDKLDPT
jgi:hypothetical protein